MIYLDSIEMKDILQKNGGTHKRRNRVQRIHKINEFLNFDQKRYRLLLVVKSDPHHVDKGHYWVIVRRHELWYVIDDHKVMAATFEVLKNESSKQIEENGLNVAFFYVRVS
jgi:ubiquitin C-terminal hydrolase